MNKNTTPARMKHSKPVVYTICALFVFTSISIYLQGKSRIKDLPERYRKWIQEEVVYIITPMEKKVFLELQTNRERDMFMDAFWRNRDPNPNTSENEYKTEHYRRINYANTRLGRGTPTKGWRTDMGRIYIILGEPNVIDRYENMTEVYPLIVWFYQGLAKYGLPDAFSVAFFKKEGSGDYILYSPVRDGPQSLLVHFHGDPKDYLAAYDKLRYIDPDIAKVSLSLIESERRLTMRPSISSDILISNKIVQAPTRRINDEYASKLLKYKKFIQTDYSINYIENDSMVRVIRHDSGLFFVHYIIEPKKLSLEQYDKNYYATLEINGSATDADEKTIYQFSKKVPIKLESEQLLKIKSKLFSFQDTFPLIEGKYKLNILLRNSSSKEFTSLDKDIIVPPATITKPRISPLTLANNTRKNPRNRGKDKAFLIHDVQLQLSPRNDFTPKDKLHLYFQLYGLTDQQKERGRLKYTIYKDKEEILNRTKNVKDYPDQTDIFEEFSLEGYSPAYYSLRVSLYTDADETHFLALQENNFYISPLSDLPRAWAVSLSAPSGSASNLNTIGNQYFNKKDYKNAYFYLERAYNGNPVSPKLALDFCRILLLAKRYEKVLRIGEPFLKGEDKHKFYAFMGFASEGLGKFEEAIGQYKNHLQHYGTNFKILNAIGNCYQKLGNNAEALVAWEKSLELDPKQEELSARVRAIKNKK